MKKNIVIAVDDFSSAQLKRIRQSVEGWADVTLILQTSSEPLYRNAIKQADICIGWPKAEWIQKSCVRFLQIGSSGWDAYQNKGLETVEGFVCCSAKGIYTVGVAEHAIAMMFALVRRIPAHVHDKDNKQFKRHLPYAAEITGTLACIVGMGETGTEIARRCKGVGMKVTGVVRKQTQKKYECADEIVLLKDLKNAVSGSDHIFLAVNGNPENENLFDKDVISCFKQSAFFYNLSRGKTVDENALYDCLATGKIAGAGLDVTATEPLPETSKLWGLGDNVLITGHSAGLSAGHTERFCNLAIRNLKNFHEGLSLENRVI